MKHLLTIFVGAGKAGASKDTALDYLAREFGGATVFEGTGAWTAINQDVIIEPVHVVVLGIPPERRNEVLSAIERLYPHEAAFGVEWRGDFQILYRGERLV